MRHEDHARRIWGAKYIPVLNGKCELAQRLVHQAHTSINLNLKRAHRTVEGSKAALQTGKFGICIPGVTSLIRTITLTCPTCNGNRKWTYESILGNKYTKLEVQAKPFRDISIDILGEMKVKPHATSRGTVKNYPLVIKCMNSGAITVQLMEESKTKDVILALLRLETRWGKINMITRDAGTNLLVGNLNPKIESQDPEAKRLLGNVEERVCEMDAQYRNYVERSV